MSITQEYLEIQEILKKAYHKELGHLDALEKIEAIVNPGPPLQWDKRIKCLLAAFLSYQSEDFQFSFKNHEDNREGNYINIFVISTAPEQIPRFQEIAEELTERFGIEVWIKVAFWVCGIKKDEASGVA